MTMQNANNKLLLNFAFIQTTEIEDLFCVNKNWNHLKNLMKRLYINFTNF